MRVVIGAGKTEFDSWLNTQESDLNLLDITSFEKLFPSKGVSCFLAEHVWEHLTFEEGIQAGRNCFDFLEPGGYLRIAVPDRNFPNEWYQNMVQVGGPGPIDHPAATHKIVYDYKLFTTMLESAGFEVNLLEYCDEDGIFHYKYWNADDGHIGRSLRFDSRNSNEQLGMVSLIADAVKVGKIGKMQ